MLRKINKVQAFKSLQAARQQHTWLRVKEALQEENVGKEVILRGWVRTVRDQKAVGFIEVNDGSSQKNAQVVVPQEAIKLLKEVSTGASVEIKGKIAKSLGQGQTTEIVIDKEGESYALSVVGACDAATYPVQNKRHTAEFLREVAHLRPRTNTTAAVIRIRNAAAMAINNYFQQKGFYLIHTPIITASDCEGAGEQFQIITTPEITKEIIKNEKQEKSDKSEAEVLFEKAKTTFFSSEAYLTVSGQLEAEIFACALSRVYTFGPTFRAELSKTTRHLAEFWMVEMEQAFALLPDIIQHSEEMVKFVIKHVLETCHDDIQFFEKWYDKELTKRLKNTLDRKFAVITYTEAVKILKASGKQFQYPVEWGRNLQSEHEVYLCEQHFDKTPTFVTDYPKDIKPFYAKVNEQDPRTVAAVDLLVPRIGELIGGSQREERYDVLKQSLTEKGVNPDKYDWYLDLRKYGTVPHGGFGLGFERMILYLTGIENIRDTIPIPRAPGYIKF